MNVKIEPSWKSLLSEEFGKEYFYNLTETIKREIANGVKIYPNGANFFKAFEMAPVDKVKAVIIGQDPYHNPGEAMGLSFSVPKGVRVPPSLRNIYKELHTDIGFEIPNHGDLTPWATQGVLLLNAILTVRHRAAASHRKLGWEHFTNAAIQKLSEKRENIVFLLWGNFAKKKKELIDTSKHLVLEAAHPSPLAGGAFFGSKHFSKTNAYLESKGIDPIDWRLA